MATKSNRFAMGAMATQSRAKGAAKRHLRRTTIEHHSGGGHTVTHQYLPKGEPMYGPSPEESQAFNSTPAMLTHLRKTLGGDGGAAPMVADTDRDQA